MTIFLARLPSSVTKPFLPVFQPSPTSSRPSSVFRHLASLFINNSHIGSTAFLLSLQKNIYAKKSS
jgi:hypothetical protein